MKLLNGYVTTKEEWVYPDAELQVLPQKLQVCMPANGKRGIQFIVEATSDHVEVKINGQVEVELFEMIAVPVEYNTVSDEAQGGQFVLMDYSQPKPVNSTRKAPYWVYDCLKPVESSIGVKDGKCAFYMTLQQIQEAIDKTKTVEITIIAGEVQHTMQVELEIYPVLIPEEKLQITNWFNLENMAKYHNLEYGTKEHMDMIRKYAKAMRRLRQTHFFIIIDDRCIRDREKWEFDFSYLKPIIEIFFSEGFTTMELGYVATRSPHYTGADFNFVLDHTINIETYEGYFLMNKYLRKIGEFLQENGWKDKVVFHISDEPDVHTADAQIIEERRKVYYMIASQLRKYIPGAKVIEAVSGPKFKGGVDIWVPLSVNYENYKEDFDQLIENGEEVWNYVCCSPGGAYLNRFLDFDLIRNRLLFWSCSAYKLSGFLHWGFNMYLEGMDVFEGTSCPNDTGLGTNFPCGDAFIVYPGIDGPWLSMRLEAQRRGAEDCELLNQLRGTNKDKYTELVGKIFRSNSDYESDVDKFEEVYQQILEGLTKQND